VLGVVPQPLEVKDVSEGVSLLGPILIAVTAILGAVLAAYTANQRHRRQLEHDTQRQKEQLAQDTQRQKEQMAHDFAMRKREHSRDALDAALELVTEVHGAFGDLEGTIDAYERERSQWLAALQPENPDEKVVRSELAKVDLEIKKAGIKFSEKIAEMFPATTRLRLRLGTKDPISKQYEKLLNAWLALEDLLVAAAEANRSQQQIDAANEVNRAAADEYAALMIECERWFN
jgi:hypothetical protein